MYQLKVSLSLSLSLSLQLGVLHPFHHYLNHIEMMKGCLCTDALYSHELNSASSEIRTQDLISEVEGPNNSASRITLEQKKIVIRLHKKIISSGALPFAKYLAWSQGAFLFLFFFFQPKMC